MAYSNTNMTSRIVVGFGLAAACAIGVSIFAVQARQQMASQAAFNASTQSLADSSAASGAASASGQEFSAPPPTEPAVIQPTAQPVESPAVAQDDTTPAAAAPAVADPTTLIDNGQQPQ